MRFDGFVKIVTGLPACSFLCVGQYVHICPFLCVLVSSASHFRISRRKPSLKHEDNNTNLAVSNSSVDAGTEAVEVEVEVVLTWFDGRPRDH